MSAHQKADTQQQKTNGLDNLIVARYKRTMSYVTIPVRVRPIKATEKVLENISNAAALGLKGDALALAAGLRPVELAQLVANDPEVELLLQTAKVGKVVELAKRLDAASAAGDTKATMTLLNKLTDGDWEPQQQAAVFGANGITINITSVKPAVEIEGNVIDG